MKFDPKKHNTASAKLNSTEMVTSVWLHKYLSSPADSQLDIASIITIDTGASHIHENLNADQAQSMIDMLTQHIEYIKQAELELIAINTKEAA